jgi:SAM-dependent methyltransferase
MYLNVVIPRLDRGIQNCTGCRIKPGMTFYMFSCRSNKIGQRGTGEDRMGWFDRVLRMNDGVCPWWLCYSFDNPLRRLIHNPVRLLEPYIKPGMTAVDIGCGMGYFTLGLAKLVGPGGRVIAVDLQEEMLAALYRRARKAGLADRIVLHRCRPDHLGVEESADFVLAFWMAHELKDKSRFFTQISAFLKPDGRLLLVEPKFHVIRSRFEQTVEACRAAGFRMLGEPAVALSRAVLMEKGGDASGGVS